MGHPLRSTNLTMHLCNVPFCYIDESCGAAFESPSFRALADNHVLSEDLCVSYAPCVDGKVVNEYTRANEQKCTVYSTPVAQKNGLARGMCTIDGGIVHVEHDSLAFFANDDAGALQTIPLVGNRSNETAVTFSGENLFPTFLGQYSVVTTNARSDLMTVDFLPGERFISQK